ncbi:uncharacterized protein LOC142242426, partial [Haematobia irritans]|uniref:uncharacterized protein LOC142242426 n=1 Tax=Haematobia irritans TaxID=7368 RepID=UPI003F4F610F
MATLISESKPGIGRISELPSCKSNVNCKRKQTIEKIFLNIMSDENKLKDVSWVLALPSSNDKRMAKPTTTTTRNGSYKNNNNGYANSKGDTAGRIKINTKGKITEAVENMTSSLLPSATGAHVMVPTISAMAQQQQQQQQQTLRPRGAAFRTVGNGNGETVQLNLKESKHNPQHHHYYHQHQHHRCIATTTMKKTKTQWDGKEMLVANKQNGYDNNPNTAAVADDSDSDSVADAAMDSATDRLAGEIINETRKELGPPSIATSPVSKTKGPSFTKEASTISSLPSPGVSWPGYHYQGIPQSSLTLPSYWPYKKCLQFPSVSLPPPPALTSLESFIYPNLRNKLFHRILMMLLVLSFVLSNNNVLMAVSAASVPPSKGSISSMAEQRIILSSPEATTTTTTTGMSITTSSSEISSYNAESSDDRREDKEDQRQQDQANLPQQNHHQQQQQQLPD